MKSFKTHLTESTLDIGEIDRVVKVISNELKSMVRARVFSDHGHVDDEIRVREKGDAVTVSLSLQLYSFYRMRPGEEDDDWPDVIEDRFEDGEKYMKSQLDIYSFVTEVGLRSEGEKYWTELFVVFSKSKADALAKKKSEAAATAAAKPKDETPMKLVRQSSDLPHRSPNWHRFNPRDFPDFDLEPFKDGPAWINTKVKLDGKPATAVWDHGGFVVTWNDEDNMKGYYCRTYDMSAACFMYLPDEIKSQELFMKGFSRLR